MKNDGLRALAFAGVLLLICYALGTGILEIAHVLVSAIVP